jgi:hypothetical protein
MAHRHAAALGLALAGLVFQAETAQAAPLMTVLIKPGVISAAANTGGVDVVETIPDLQAPAGQTLFSLVTQTPGYAYPQKIGVVTATDAQGDVPLSAQGGHGQSWTSSRAVSGALTIRYHLPLENIPMLSGGPSTGLRLDGDGFSGQGSGLVMSPNTTTAYRVAIRWDLSAMGPGAEGVSSFGDGDVDLDAAPVGRLEESIFMAGHLHREPAKGTAGAFSSVWLVDPPFDVHETMHWTGQLHAWMSRHFNDQAEPPYRVFIRFNPMNAPSGAAFPHSFIITWGDNVTSDFMKTILGYEMTHTWTALELGKWYSEGNAVYYQAQLAWRAGMITTDGYLNDINETASRYYTDILNTTPEMDAEPRFWEDTRIRVLPYDRGALYFGVLNGKIRHASGGKRSIDDLIQAMDERAKAGRPVSEAVWLEMLRQEIGEAGPQVHRSMMTGGLMLPESGDYGPCFRRTIRKIRRFDFGFDPKSVVGPERVIQGLIPGSEAEKAGLRNGDAISYGVSLDVVQAKVNRTFTLKVTRDGKTFPITYLPRGEAVDAYQWERVPGVSDEACKAALEDRR